ncbi:hypothetical protein [Pseudomonas sp. P5_A2_2]
MLDVPADQFNDALVARVETVKKMIEAATANIDEWVVKRNEIIERSGEIGLAAIAAVGEKLAVANGAASALLVELRQEIGIDAPTASKHQGAQLNDVDEHRPQTP